MRFMLLATTLLLVGCTSEAQIQREEREREERLRNAQKIDQCLRSQLFQQCLDKLPKGPERTHYNDWAEVIDECETAARNQSIRRASTIKPECVGY